MSQLLNMIPMTDLKMAVESSVTEVFDTMLSMPVETLDAAERVSLPGECLVGSVGFGGAVAGMICMHITEAFSREVTASMLGVKVHEVSGDDDINDAIGEVTNMIAGNVKSLLSSATGSCSLSIPSIARGGNMAVETISSAENQHFVFRHAGQHVLVDLYVKFGG